jgi:hypothetical protein
VVSQAVYKSGEKVVRQNRANCSQVWVQWALYDGDAEGLNGLQFGHSRQQNRQILKSFCIAMLQFRIYDFDVKQRRQRPVKMTERREVLRMDTMYHLTALASRTKSNPINRTTLSFAL